MALLANYYVNWQTGDDGQDGDAPTHSGGTDGPKKHVNAILDLIKNPAEAVSGEIIINVAGDVAHPENYIYQDGTDVNIDLTTSNMSNPNARIVFRLTGWDNEKYNAGTEAPDGGAGWAVGNVKPATLAPLIVDYGRVDVVGLGLSDPSGLYPVAATGPWGELTLNYCRLSGGLAGLRGDGDMSLVNGFVTDNDSAFCAREAT